MAPVSSDSPDEDRTKGRAFAHIRYADQSGQKAFEVTKNLTVIGRGGRSYWVDLRLETASDKLKALQLGFQRVDVVVQRLAHITQLLA